MPRIIPRREWGARPANRIVRDKMPWKRAYLHHTVTAPGGAEVMRQVQDDHLGRGWADFAYNYGFSVDGQIFEGRGRGVRHGNEDAGASVTFVLLGNFEIAVPPEPMLDAVAWACADLFLAGDLEPAGLTGGHRDLEPTACPGRHAYAAIPEINRSAKAIVDQVVAGAPAHPATPEVPDVIPPWAAAAWSWATGRGLIKNDRPNDPVTRAELAVILHRAFTDPDGTVPPWAASAYAALGGLIQRPEPDAPVTEARFVTLLHRALGRSDAGPLRGPG